MSNQSLIQALSTIRATYSKGARFASILYTAKGSGEVARHTVCLGVSYIAACKRDLATLIAKRSTLTGIALVACDELIASLRASITGYNPAYTLHGVYTKLALGIKEHAETGELYVSGFTIGKTVLVPGVYKTVNSSDKTIAKNILRKGFKSGKTRDFSLAATTVIKADGKVLTFAPAAPVPIAPASVPTVPAVAVQLAIPVVAKV